MHQTNHARMETILAYSRTPVSRPSLLHSILPKRALRPLPSEERICNGDVIEDIETGTRERVFPTSFYGFLRGIPVEQAKKLPAVFDVLRVVA